jgi:serine/threonine-protein kinase
MEDLTGQHFGAYKLDERVGTGGMASIYKAFDKTLSRWVALKVISIETELIGSADETLLARFRQEAQAIAQLRHSNIVTVYDYGEAKEWAYIVMEYVPNGSLKDRLHPNTPLDWQQTLNVVIPVARALAFAHHQGIIHRDIKPANILLPTPDWPLLADFGLVKMQRSTRAELTAPGQVMGTIAYAAPEQMQAGQIDTRADIYALGVVLYELLTGRLPFQEQTPFELLMARLSDPPIPLLQANPAVSPLFVPIIEKALAQHPDDRYPSMKELACELMEVRDELSMAGEKSAVMAATALAALDQVTVRLKVEGTGQDILTTGRTEVVIGRAHKAGAPDIDLGPYGGSQAGVSRRHNRLLHQADGWFVEDLGSANGTFVNGVKVTPQRRMALKKGDVIRCGQIELKFGTE